MAPQIDATMQLSEPIQSFEMDSDLEARPPLLPGKFEVLGEFAGEYVLDEAKDTEREFKLVMSDQRALSVRGRSVKFVTSPTGEPFWGVVASNRADDEFAALFPLADVKAVFSGEVTFPFEGS